MKAVLRFDTNDEDGRIEFRHACLGSRYKGALEDIYAFLREKKKYNPPKGKEATELLEEVFKCFVETTEDLEVPE